MGGRRRPPPAGETLGLMLIRADSSAVGSYIPEGGSGGSVSPRADANRLTDSRWSATARARAAGSVRALAALAPPLLSAIGEAGTTTDTPATAVGSVAAGLPRCDADNAARSLIETPDINGARSFASEVVVASALFDVPLVFPVLLRPRRPEPARSCCSSAVAAAEKARTSALATGKESATRDGDDDDDEDDGCWR